MTYPPSAGWPSQDQWEPPPPPPMASLGNHVGQLVWVRFIAFQADAMLPWGIKDAVTVEWEVLTGPDTGEHEELQVSNVMLVRQLRDAPPGKEMFSRVAAQGTGKGNPAIYLGPKQPGDDQLIQAWLARRAPQGGRH